MTTVSITSTDSFAARAQQSEVKRLYYWLVTLAGMLVVTVARRVAGGVVMTDNEVFFPFLSILLLGIVVQIIMLAALKRANRAGYLLPRWVSAASAAFDLGIVAGLLVVVGFFSPRGAVPALSGPTLLLLPLVVLMSILRLRPAFTLYIGLAGAIIHLLLAARAILNTHSPPETYAVYFAYGGILVLTAVIGMVVSNEVRSHVREAASEASRVFRMEHDLATARIIQQGLFPRRPAELEGFEISAMNRPAEQTGGDYYDWQQLPDGRLAVVLADVSGHGIGPAIVMAVCRAYARSTTPLMPDPAALLRRLNELLHDDLPDDRFITFVVAVLDPNGSVDLISAGHGPTLLFSAAEGKIARFDGDGPPLAVVRGTDYGPINTLKLAEGDVLMMLTDGFFEWSRTGDSELFGIDRLQAALQESAGGNAATILRSVDETIRRFCDGSPQSDDMTAIVIKRVGTSLETASSAQSGRHSNTSVPTS